MNRFEPYAFCAQPDFDEPSIREAFSHAVPLKTLVIYCYDPRAAEIPRAIANKWPNEVFPGSIVADAEGRKVASTTTIFPVVVAGGRAVDALRSITVAQHLFGIENIVVVHHSHCGATTFSEQGITEAFRREQEADIAGLYDADSICISDYEASLRSDVSRIRKSPGTPRGADIYGFFYDIDSGELTEVVRDLAEAHQHARAF
jgi:carbonic anhydrase